MHYVYILQSESNGKYYIGTTNNVKRRIKEHDSGFVNSTKSNRPWRLRKIEEFETINKAYSREKFLKSRKSRKIIDLVLKSQEV